MKEMLRRKKSVNERQHIVASVCVPLFENLEKKDTKLDFLASGFRAMFFSAKQFFSDKRKKNVF